MSNENGDSVTCRAVLTVGQRRFLDEEFRGAVHQQDVAAHCGQAWDAVILGAGPAGASAALRLAQNGLRVALIDAQEFPREKICGDGLVADSMRCLETMGLASTVTAHAMRLDSAAVFSPAGHSFRLRAPCSTIPRIVLDAILVRRAVEAGAVFCRGRARQLSHSTGGQLRVRFAGGAGTLNARVGIYAAGAHLGPLRPLGAVSGWLPNAVAFRCYVRSSHPGEELLVAYDRSVAPGYAWIFPMQQGWYNMGCGVFHAVHCGGGSRGRRAVSRAPDLRQCFGRFLQVFPPARAVMERSSAMTALRGFPLRCGLQGTSPFVPPALLVAGESMATTFPFTGEGIGKAMETGLLAADVAAKALAAGDLGIPREYPARIRSEILPRYRGYAATQWWLGFPSLTDMVTRRAARSPRLQQALEGIVNETTSPGEILSLRGFLRSLW